MKSKTTTELPLRCKCGLVQGILKEVNPEQGNRVVCLCDDCQAYAKFLGQPGIVDANGGTDIFQVPPTHLQITAGAEQLRCMRLTPKGLLRWYTGCCRTPVGNTLITPRLPFVGVVHSFIDRRNDASAADRAMGPPRGFILGRFAKGGCPPHAHPAVPFPLIVRSARLLFRSWRKSRGRTTPFFTHDGRPVATPEILTRQARDNLR